MPEERFPASEWGHAQFLGIGRELALQRIHLHLYPAPDPNIEFESFFSSYLRENDRNPHFHFHRPLPFRDLIERLSRYDAGWHVLGVNGVGRLTKTKLYYNSANKIFDCIEAGIPVLSNSGFHQHGILKHFGAAIRIKRIEDTRRLLTEYYANPPVHGSKTAGLKSQAGRLQRMYIKVAYPRSKNERTSTLPDRKPELEAANA